NCGAIPPDLVEAFFFGHEKGAYTGADKERTGYFELANHGSLFLDEIGELPLNAQVKLLRAIEEGEISKIGGTKTIKIDIKIIAATNRNLIEAVASKSFREDLLHRIAVGVLNLPPIRERHGDINPIIDHILESINKKFDKGYGWQHKKLSAGARNLMHQLSWRGNVRELSNTLTRAAIMVTGTTVETDDIRDALFSVDNSQKDNNKILNRSLGNGFSLTDVIADVARHYLERSNEEAKGNKKKIASLLGFPNYQTASNWMKKYGLK
ncbi:AAA family ATPase, partial [Patescibacteria group bacterium]